MIIWHFIVVGDGLLTVPSLWMLALKLHIWDQQPQRAKMVLHLRCCWLHISRQLEGPRGAKELHRLWTAANALTLWRAQPLSLPLDLCENLFYDAVFFFFLFKNCCSASDCGSPNEHLPGAAFSDATTNTFLYKIRGFTEITPIISPLALKAPLAGLVPVETPEAHSLKKPSWPRALIPTDALIRASSDWGPPKAPSPGSLTGKEGFYWPCGRQPAFKPPPSSSPASEQPTP